MLIHESTREFIFAVKRNRLHIRAQYSTKCPINISIFYWNRFHSNEVSSEQMTCVGADSERLYFEAELSFDETAQYIQYYFVADHDGTSEFWGRSGRESARPKYYFEYLATAENDILAPPAWASGSVWYQIFPERYDDGDPENNPQNVEPWGAKPTRENHFGGDLAGIYKKVPYLKKLGVDVLYMTPVFSSPSNHKYDTTDYFEIDPAFGTTQDLIQLVQECHANGIRVILDGVFNHIGYSSKQFQDVVEKGASSEFADWFYIKDFPIQTDPLNYECVGYYKWMPKLRYKTQAVRDYILRVGRYWIETADIDGWRLDVADEVDFTFWQEFRWEMKRVKPDAFLLAETWKDGRDMLRGDQMDSVMNYLFRDAVLDFFARQEIDAKTFEHRLSQMLYGYSAAVRPVLYNLLGSHDTARLLTECGGNLNQLKLAAAFQITFSGMPAIYYGDEIGMDGENDPDCRKTMAWDMQNDDLLRYYEQLISLRHQTPSLQFGDLKFVYAEHNVIAFARTYNAETTYAIFNNTTQEQTVCIPVLGDADEIAWMQTSIDYQLSVERNVDAQSENAESCWQYNSIFKAKLKPFSFGTIIFWNKKARKSSF